MSVNNQYCSEYRKKIVESARNYINKKSIVEYLDNFYIKPDSEQGQLVLSVLKSNKLLFDERYLSTPLSTNPDLKLCCCTCSSQPYTQWKLIGVTCDQGSEVVKCTLPYLLCEGCYRKRFCDQKQTRYLCNIAVFPLMDPPKKKLNPSSSSSTTVAMSNPKYLSNSKPIPVGISISTPVGTPVSTPIGTPVSVPRSIPAPTSAPAPASVPASAPTSAPAPVSLSSSVPAPPSSSSASAPPSTSIPPSMSVATPSLSSAPVSVPPSLSHSAPIPSTVLPQPISYQVPPPTMDYGVDDVLGETRVSDPHSISGYSQPDPTTEAILQEMEEDDPLELQDEAFLGGSATQGETGMEEQMSQEEGAQEQTEEITFTLPFRQGGFFRTWLMSFFVVDRYSIRMYQNEKRNERKMKEILLVDAVVQKTQVHSDAKHPYCVSIQPGPSSEYTKSFVIALPSPEEESEFIKTIQKYINLAQSIESHVCSQTVQ